MKITINLATRPFANLGPVLRNLRIAMAVFAVLSIGLGFGLHILHAKAEAARAHNHSLDGQIAAINGERQGYEAMMRQPDNAQVLDQSGNLNRLFDQKAFSWTLAMEDLETVLPGGVQVTTLEPLRDEKTGSITLRLRVVGPRDRAVELVHNLEYSRHFIHPSIVNESTESTGGPGERLEPVSPSNKVNFDLLAEYNPATFGDRTPAVRNAAAKAEDGSGVSHPALVAARTAAPGATGPGLRRPPYTGTSQPPAAPQARRQNTPQAQPATRRGPGGRQ